MDQTKVDNEVETLRYLLRARREILTARQYTTCGVVKDYCTASLKQLRPTIAQTLVALADEVRVPEEGS